MHADLLLQISDNESFGLTSLEALACGVPVIGTSGSGIEEAVLDKNNALLSRPGDTGKMIRDALSILTDSKKADSFSKHGISWAGNNFSSDKIVMQYENFYGEVMKR